MTSMIEDRRKTELLLRISLFILGIFLLSLLVHTQKRKPFHHQAKQLCLFTQRTHASHSKSYFGLTRQKTELTLVISTVQLRLVGMVTEWDSAVLGMVTAAGGG